MDQSLSKKHFKKPPGPNGSIIIMVLGKAGSRQGTFWYETVGVFWRLLMRKGGPKGPFLKIMKIDPPKRSPGAGWEKHEKTMKFGSEH